MNQLSGINCNAQCLNLLGSIMLRSPLDRQLMRKACTVLKRKWSTLFPTSSNLLNRKSVGLNIELVINGENKLLHFQ